MSSYVNNISIYGLMNRNAFIDETSPGLSFYKNKDRSKITVCRNRLAEELERNYKQINYMYLDSEPSIKNSYSMSQVTSIISSDYFTGMPGKKFIDLRHTVNQLSKKIKAVPLSVEMLKDVDAMIEGWRYDDNGGMKYGWQEHAGIDKAIVTKYCTDSDFRIFTFGYAFYYDYICIGYAIMSKEPSEFHNGIPEFSYLTRKVRNIYKLRNLTEYIDWFMFSKVYGICKSDFLINWGCSSKGVLWYKTHKWPVYKLEEKWFGTIKNN